VIPHVVLERILRDALSIKVLIGQMEAAWNAVPVSDFTLTRLFVLEGLRARTALPGRLGTDAYHSLDEEIQHVWEWLFAGSFYDALGWALLPAFHTTAGLIRIYQHRVEAKLSEEQIKRIESCLWQ
jgi:hypothetical protein